MKRITKKRILQAEKKYKADPNFIKKRSKLIHKPEIELVDDYDADRMTRVLFRVDKTNFPEFALYQKEVDDGLIKALKHAALKKEEKDK